MAYNATAVYSASYSPISRAPCHFIASSRPLFQTSVAQRCASSSFHCSSCCLRQQRGSFCSLLMPCATGGGSRALGEGSKPHPSRSAISRHGPNPKSRVRQHTDSSGSNLSSDVLSAAMFPTRKAGNVPGTNTIITKTATADMSWMAAQAQATTLVHGIPLLQNAIPQEPCLSSRALRAPAPK